ncbi:hypothetical protein F4808DRAFT_213115 [Astrocystis sublimbata]|nr:hypothetical protein F4808DRAFT_213115 [Astrocystis sublimbata]
MSVMMRLLSIRFPIQRLAAGYGHFRHHIAATLICPPRVTATPIWSAFDRQQRYFLASQASQAPEVIPLDVLVDEEQLPRYKPEHYYPANPGDVLNNQYELKVKIGWGSSSTVWLAQGIGGSPNRYVAIKICNCNYASEEDQMQELDVTAHVLSLSSKHRGSGIVGTAIEGCFCIQ